MAKKVLKACLFAGMRLAILWSVLSSTICMAGQAAPSYGSITWLTSHYPPATWQDLGDGSPRGIFIEILQAIAGDEVDLKTIAFHPWARSYRILQTQPMTALFAISDTPERRKLFKFSDAVVTSRFGIICRKSVVAKLKAAGKIAPSYSIGKNLKDKSPLAHLTIGVEQDDVAEQIIRQDEDIAPKAIVSTTSFKRLAKRLIKGRIDAIAFNESSAWTKLRTLAKTDTELVLKDYEMIYVLAEQPVSFAFHRDVPQALVDRFNADLGKLKASGKVNAIVGKHLR